MSKVFDFTKEKAKRTESNVLDFNQYKKKREKQGMTEKEFKERYMKDSVVSLFGEETLNKFFNNDNTPDDIA